MSTPARHRSTARASITAFAMAGGLLLAACGGGSSDDGAGGSGPEGGDVDLERASDIVDGAIADTSADAKATIVMDGTTYTFEVAEDPTGDATPFCTTVAGSLQGDLLLVDESGAVVEDGEVSFTLFGPDAAYSDGGTLQEVYIDLPSGPEFIGPLSYMSDAETIESEVSDRNATATFTVRHHTGDLDGTLDVSC